MGSLAFVGPLMLPLCLLCYAACSVNCRELAEYDIVLTTPALATSKHILK